MTEKKLKLLHMLADEDSPPLNFLPRGSKLSMHEVQGLRLNRKHCRFEGKKK